MSCSRAEGVVVGGGSRCPGDESPCLRRQTRDRFSSRWPGGLFCGAALAVSPERRRQARGVGGARGAGMSWQQRAVYSRSLLRSDHVNAGYAPIPVA
jgi:hypothetical protein